MTNLVFKKLWIEKIAIFFKIVYQFFELLRTSVLCNDNNFGEVIIEDTSNLNT
jgi:hypothetical protein